MSTKIAPLVVLLFVQDKYFNWPLFCGQLRQRTDLFPIIERTYDNTPT